MSDLQKAIAFAKGAHAGQTYGKGLPYTHHLEQTAGWLKTFGCDGLVMEAAWLHDTMEDTGVTYDLLFQEFGSAIANVVDAVTDRPGKNRAERHAQTYPMIRYIGGPTAVLVKLADRIANVEYSISSKNTGKLKMYRKEYPDFQRLIGRVLGHPQRPIENAMWNHLDLLFKETP